MVDVILWKNISRAARTRAKRKGARPKARDVAAGISPLFLTDHELRQAIEMLFFAYRDFVAEPDQILAGMGLGRAHHRALYFIGRYPDQPVSNLLQILQISKQSLNRVLRDLMQQGLVIQQPGPSDRRQRLLSLSPAGLELEEKLTECQRQRIRKAYKQAGADAVDGFRLMMLSLMSNAEDRDRFMSTPAQNTSNPQNLPLGAIKEKTPDK